MPLPGILPEGRTAIPAARAVLAAFDGLHLTILAHRNILLPWPETPPDRPGHNM